VQLQVAVFFCEVCSVDCVLQGWTFKRFVSLDSVAGAPSLFLADHVMCDAAHQDTTDTAPAATWSHAQAIGVARACGGPLRSTWCLRALVRRLQPLAAACRPCSTATRPRPPAPAV
jgi:hypothetical protein